MHRLVPVTDRRTIEVRRFRTIEAVQVLPQDEWVARRRAHERRVDAWIEPHLGRRRRGETHAVDDFLFTYYSYRPAALRRWHPGVGVALEGNMPYSRMDRSVYDGRLALELGVVPGGYGWVFPKGDHANFGVGGWEAEGPRLRDHLRRLCEQRLPQLAVCSYNEIVPGVGVETLAVLGPQNAPVGVA